MPILDMTLSTPSSMAACSRSWASGPDSSTSTSRSASAATVFGGHHQAGADPPPGGPQPVVDGAGRHQGGDGRSLLGDAAVVDDQDAEALAHQPLGLVAQT